MKTDQDLDEAISEHQHLIKVLRSTSHEDDRREAKKQAAELKTLRRKKVRDGLPAKPAPEAYPGVEPGDSLYIHHPKRGPLAVKVHAQGRHGITATDSEGNWHRAQWQHVLGAKQRLSQRLTLVDQGEDGAIVEDEQGQRRYIAIDPEARPDPEPLRKSQQIATQAQIEAGNYKKLHVRFQGLDISIENPKGSVRTGTDPGGKTWRVTMHHAYGYIRGTCGVDKDHVDCYLGPNPDASHAYVVHQRQAGKWDRYDEDKVMLGFDSAEDAKAAYLTQYDDPRFFGTMTALPMADFKRKALATRNRPQMIKGQVLFFKTHIDGYTTKHGTFVAPHEDKRAPAKEPSEKPSPFKPDPVQAEAFRQNLDRVLTSRKSDVVKPAPIQKALILFLKADVKGHTRRLANGKIVTVKPYRDKRGHQADKHSGELFANVPARPHAIRLTTPPARPAPRPAPDPEPTATTDQGFIKITAYRKKSSPAIGSIGAGTFYFLNTKTIPSNELYKYQLEFAPNKLLKVSQDVVDYFGLPSEALANQWFPHRRWSDDEAGGIEMDRAVAAEAIKRGYQAIQYGDTELQILDPEKTPKPPAPKPRKLTQIEKLRARMADLFATVPDPEPTQPRRDPL